MQKKIIGIAVGILVIIKGYLRRKAEEIAKQPTIKKIADHPTVKEVRAFGEDVKEASKEAGKETIEQSKKAHRRIARMSGAKKMIGYSILGAAAFVIYGVPGILTAIVVGKVGMKLSERRKKRKHQKNTS